MAKYADVIIVAPEQPQSATALSLTFHKPLRVAKSSREEFECYAVSGSPGDCVMIGVNKLLPRRPDLVVSGINIGDNNTYQDLLASGTVAAALEAAISGYSGHCVLDGGAEENRSSPFELRPAGLHEGGRKSRER